MNKKIIISLSVIAAVAAVVIGGTISYFSDTETSTGNTFTAGSIDLKVDSTQHYNNAVCVNNAWALEPNKTADTPQYPVIGSACDGTWVAADLGAQKFFNFADIKPGDSGENTISLNVTNNDAWACADVNVTKNADVTSTEPELAAGDTLAVPGSTTDGELAQNVYFTAWADDGDNIWEANEPLLFTNHSGPASDVLGGKTYTIADSTTGAMTGGSTKYIGLAWCAGTQTVNETAHTITCNGATMGNNAQTDMMEASIAFRVEQSRNNAGFTCAASSISTVRVSNLDPSFTAQDGGGVYAAYYGPTDYNNPQDPGNTALYDGRAAGIIKAGINIDANGHYYDEGLLGFKVPTVAISTFAGQVLTYDVENQTGPNPVWVRIRLVGGTQYQFVPTTNPFSWHTVNAAAGQWQLMDNSGNATGPMMTLSQVATANPGAQVDRVYLTLGIGDSYNVSLGVGTVGWVDKVTIGGVTYDFVL
jgi:predicted ribosomally synthesized peptide with SipW-like signal peptide